VAIISGSQLAHALAGMPYPARRWQTLTWADFNCASDQVRDALRRLPDKTYSTPRELLEALAAIER
jgi:hypothetical protein